MTFTMAEFGIYAFRFLVNEFGKGRKIFLNKPISQSNQILSQESKNCFQWWKN